MSSEIALESVRTSLASVLNLCLSAAETLRRQSITYGDPSIITDSPDRNDAVPRPDPSRLDVTTLENIDRRVLELSTDDSRMRVSCVSVVTVSSRQLNALANY
jgi:hypothetical protein